MVLTTDTTYCGTRTGYVYGCRCEPCREADRVYKRHLEAARKGKRPETWEEYRARVEAAHGSYTRYRKYGCRCAECRGANARQHANFSARHVNKSRSTEFCEECERWFTPHGMKCHQTACHSQPHGDSQS